ncbi:MAG: PIN domain-containing protein [Lachnospiraceae bacterium]|nr:PIN domain-containing protein [Lachnospiraceae bacterium]
MEYISSDTNIWIDFSTISSIEIPFRLPCTYIMFHEALENEVLSPVGLVSDLTKLGLVGVEIDTEEFFYTYELAEKYKRLSVYDRVALAIAKKRNIMLLTGDNALRKAAMQEGVSVMGTIGLLDRLYEEGRIRHREYEKCLRGFLKHSERRLPKNELEDRLKKLKGGNA